MELFKNINFLHVQIFILIVALFFIFVTTYKKGAYREVIKKKYVLFPIIGIFIIILVAGYINLSRYKEKVLGIRAPNLSYYIDGKIFVKGEEKNRFKAEIKNLSSSTARDVELYIIGRLGKEQKYEEIGKFSIAEIRGNEKIVIDPEILTYKINNMLAVMPGGLEEKVIERIILSARYKDEKGNLYDDWVRKKPVFFESKIKYAE